MKTKKTYSLFAKEGKKWTRLTPVATDLKAARQLFQGPLLGGTMNGACGLLQSGFEMALRPAEDDFANAAEYRLNMYRVFTPIAGEFKLLGKGE